jgi:hypothetical protein
MSRASLQCLYNQGRQEGCWLEPRTAANPDSLHRLPSSRNAVFDNSLLKIQGCCLARQTAPQQNPLNQRGTMIGEETLSMAVSKGWGLRKLTSEASSLTETHI